jgi:hypothetical protein
MKHPSPAAKLAYAVCLLSILTIGCGPGTEQSAAKKDDHHHAEHAEHGPRGGELIAIDDGRYHAELLIDAEGDTVTLYMLDGKAEEAITVARQEPVMKVEVDGESQEFRFNAVPTDEDTNDMTSRFEVASGELAAALKTDAKETARLAVEIDGKQLSGEIESHDHHHHHHGHGHDHGHDDDDDESAHLLVWQEKDIELSGHNIQLGHRGLVAHAGEDLEPAVIVERDGDPVDGASAFASLVATDADTVLVEEKSLVLEPASEDEPAHFAGVHLPIPADAKQVVIRYRIELPDGAGAETYNVRVNTETED